MFLGAFDGRTVQVETQGQARTLNAANTKMRSHDPHLASDQGNPILDLYSGSMVSRVGMPLLRDISNSADPQLMHANVFTA